MNKYNQLSKKVCRHCLAQLSRKYLPEREKNDLFNNRFHEQWKRGYTPCDVTGKKIRLIKGPLPVDCPYLFEHSVAAAQGEHL